MHNAQHTKKNYFGPGPTYYVAIQSTSLLDSTYLF